MQANFSNQKVNNHTHTNLLIDYLEGVIGDEMILNSFIRDLQIINQSETSIVIKVQSLEALNLINAEYKEIFLQAIETIFNRNLEYQLILPNQETKKHEQIIEKPSFKNINQKYLFQNYVTSNFNQEVVTIAKKIVTKIGKYSPFYINAKSGLGKTHLLHAIGNEAIKNGYSAIYIEPNKFTRDVVETIKKGHDIINFTESFAQYDFLLFDDIQNLGDRNVTLNVLFNIINKHIEEEKQIIICSDKLARELSGFEERFITRFVSGIASTIYEPDINDLVKILEFKLDWEKLHPQQWEKEAIKFIARNNSYSIRSLEGAIKRVLFFAENSPNIKFTFAIISNIFKELDVDPIELTPNRVLNTICSYYKISKKDLIGKSRKKEFITARHMAIWLIKKINNLSYVEIGNLFNNRDHSTIISAIKNIERLMINNKTVKIAAEKIEEKIKKIN